MPIVALECQFRFVVNTRENAFALPHVHVWVGNEDVCRIKLNWEHIWTSLPLRLPGRHAGVRKTRGADQANVGHHP